MNLPTSAKRVDDRDEPWKLGGHVDALGAD
jgi:hypothetical protein